MKGEGDGHSKEISRGVSTKNLSSYQHISLIDEGNTIPFIASIERNRQGNLKDMY